MTETPKQRGLIRHAAAKAKNGGMRYRAVRGGEIRIGDAVVRIESCEVVLYVTAPKDVHFEYVPPEKT